MSTIVVGLDGSDAALDALRFALDEAKVRGAEVKAVNAWHIPPMAYGAGWAPTSIDFEGFTKVAQETLDASLRKAGAAESGVEIVTEVEEGQPAEVLLEAARGADLLVVGSRGLGGFRGLLLGSVSQQCSQYAPCPVVVIPHKRDR
jgi:nucleotide-binding universal stress UspA family protein